MSATRTFHRPTRGRYIDKRADAEKTGFTGFGRCGTGADRGNRFRFQTIKPGSIGSGSAPHIEVIVNMRGMLSHAFTRVYFDDEAEANAREEVLVDVPAERRGTLIARREALPDGVVYHSGIRMQGPEETVFFDM